MKIRIIAFLLFAQICLACQQVAEKAPPALATASLDFITGAGLLDVPEKNKPAAPIVPMRAHAIHANRCV